MMSDTVLGFSLSLVLGFVVLCWVAMVVFIVKLVAGSSYD